MKTLIIAEKPSVAQDIVRALTPVAGKFEKHDEHFENERYVVSSAVGHLVEIQAPEAFDVKRGKWSFAHLPVIPPHFDLKPVDKTKTRLNAVVRLAKRKAEAGPGDESSASSSEHEEERSDGRVDKDGRLVPLYELSD